MLRLLFALIYLILPSLAHSSSCGDILDHTFRAGLFYSEVQTAAIHGGTISIRQRPSAMGELTVLTSVPHLSISADNTKISKRDQALVTNSIESSSKKLSAFLKMQYARRKWSNEFTELATEPNALIAKAQRSIRSIVLNSRSEIVGSVALVYSPYLVIRDPTSGLSFTLPWMTEEGLSNSEKTGFQNVQMDSWLLPIEKFFRIQFDRTPSTGEVPFVINGKVYQISQGFLIELGSYGIDLDSPLRDEISKELYFELLVNTYEAPFTLAPGIQGISILSQMINPVFSQQGFFLSYGENVGQRLYRPYGFSSPDGISINKFNVNWKPLVTGGSLHSTFVKTKGYADVASAAFQWIERNGVEIQSGNNWFNFSESQDLASIVKANQFKQKFFGEIEPNLREKTLPFIQVE